MESRGIETGETVESDSEEELVDSVMVEKKNMLDKNEIKSENLQSVGTKKCECKILLHR